MTSPTPDGRSREERLQDAIAAYLDGAASGQPIDPERFAADHPDLADDLRAFLADHERMAAAAAPVRRGLEGDAHAPDAAPAPTLGDGETVPGVGARVKYFGDYELLEEVARGGMGVVYRARQVSLDRVVALKMILAGGHAGADDLERFLTEAKAVAQLQHPNLVPLYEAGAHDGLPYLTLEFVPGGSLADKLKGTPLPPAEAARLVEQAARGVQHAHEKGVVHRDLKPANVLLAEDGAAKVTDFGLARRVDGSEQLTATGAVLGTPPYMAPEQASGGSNKVGPAADVYGLGAILYECLTGRPPFQAPTPLETLMQVMKAEPVPPSQLQPKLPRDLQTICLKCLQKEPGKRYASAADLAEDLRRYQAGEPIKARPVGRVERLVRWARRRPAAALATFTGLAFVVAVTVFSIRQVRLNEQLRQEADLREQHAKMSELQYRVSLYGKGFDRALLMWQSGDLEGCRKILAGLDPELQSWEWDFLQRLCIRSEGRDGNQPGISASAVGLMCAPSGNGPLLGTPALHLGWGQKLGGVTSGLVARSWAEPFGEVSALAVSPDGKWIASGVHHAVKIRDSATGKIVHTFTGPVGDVTGVAFSPDGKHFASMVRKSRGRYRDMIQLWNADTGEDLLILESKQQDLTSLAYSLDGRSLATSGANSLYGDSPLVLWDAATGKRLTGFSRTVGDRSVSVFCVAFSPDGHLITGGEMIHFQDRIIQMPTVRALAMSPDGKQILSGCENGTVHLLDATTGAQVRTLPGHSGQVKTVAWVPGSDYVVSSGTDKMIRVADACTGKALWALRAHMGKQEEPAGESGKAGGNEGVVVAVSPDGKLVFSTGDVVRAWDITNGKAVRTLDNSAWVKCLAISPDGKRLLGGGKERIALWDLVTGKAIVMEGHTGPVTHLAFKDNHQIVSFSSLRDRDGPFPSGEELGDRTAREWNLITRQEVKRYECPESHGYRLDREGHLFSMTNVPRDKTRGDSEMDQEVRDIMRDQVLPTLHGGAKQRSAHCLAFDPEGNFLVTGGWDSDVTVWNAKSGKRVHALTGHTGSITTVAFSPDGRRILTGSRGGREPDRDRPKPDQVKVWDRETGKELLSLTAHANLEGLQFSPDGKRILGYGKSLIRSHPGFEVELLSKPILRERPLSIEDSHAIVVWDSVTGQELLALNPGGTATRVAFAPGGKYLVGADSREKVLKVWEVASGDEYLTLHGHADAVHCVAFNPDGRHIVSSGGRPPRAGWEAEGSRCSPEAKVWNVSMGLELFRLGGDGSTFHSVAYSPDGRHIVCGDESGGPMFHYNKGEVVRSEMPSDQHTHMIYEEGGDLKYVDSLGNPIKGKSGQRSEMPADWSYSKRGGAVTVWDAASGKRVTTLHGHRLGVRHSTFSPDGACIASVGAEGVVKTWDFATQKELGSISHKGWGKGNDEITRLRFSPDGRQLIGGPRTRHRPPIIWDRTTGAEVGPKWFSGADPSRFGGVYSPDGRLIAVGASSGPRLIDAATGKVHDEFPAIRVAVGSVAFSPDGKYLAGGCHDRTLRIWRTADRQLVRTLRGHLAHVLSIDWSRDGRFIVSGAEDRLIKLWDVSDLATSPAK